MMVFGTPIILAASITNALSKNPDRKRPAIFSRLRTCFFAPWAAGTGSPAGSPYTVGVKEPTENQSNGIVETSVFKTVGSDIRLQRCRGVPQSRPTRPPGGQNLLLTVITYIDIMRNKEITSVVHWQRQLQPGSNMPAGDFFVYIKNNTL